NISQHSSTSCFNFIQYPVKVGITIFGTSISQSMIEDIRNQKNGGQSKSRQHRSSMCSNIFIFYKVKASENTNRYQGIQYCMEFWKEIQVQTMFYVRWRNEKQYSHYHRNCNRQCNN